MTIVLKKSLGAEKLKQIIREAKQPKGFDAFKHCGVIKLTTDPVASQRQIRDEWN
jgi:hypothetical protein